MARDQRVVIGGVDTHKDVHVAAVIDERGKILDTAEFETTTRGYRSLLEWMLGYGVSPASESREPAPMERGSGVI